MARLKVYNESTGQWEYTGTSGADGVDGQGVPTGGATGQVLVKDSNTDFDTSWQTQDLSAKQDLLVSGTNIKTVNGTTLLGSGDIATPNTTYSEITEANIENASSSTAGLISGRRAEALMDNEASKSRTLSNKTLTSPTISGNPIFPGTFTTNGNNVAFPNAATTIVGRSTSDTMTNKTIVSPVIDTGVSGSAIKDEDDMTSDSASHLATQQSIKAYVDNAINARTLADNPVGTIRINRTSSANPNTLPGLAGTTWTQITDKMIMGRGSTYTADGGAATHTHPLSDSAWAQNFIGNGSAEGRFITSATSYTTTRTNSGGGTGGGSTTVATPLAGTTDSGSAIPPMIVAYIWERTA